MLYPSRGVLPLLVLAGAGTAQARPASRTAPASASTAPAPAPPVPAAQTSTAQPPSAAPTPAAPAPTPPAPVTPTAPPSAPASDGPDAVPPTGAGPATDASGTLDLDGDGDIDDRKLLDAAEVVEVQDKSEGRKLVESARPVTVIETRQARERTADLGEVLSRSQGIQVRRSGGLGAAARFSLNGLYDNQIRFFVDGIPLELAGWDGGIADLPPDLVDRIEVHRGVVPIALSADALGGAVDLVTNPSWLSRAAASYQYGSFGTHRATVLVRAKDPPSGAALGVNFFVDRARNDYRVAVDIPDDRGQLHAATVRRFHDAYQAVGGTVEGGIVNRGWLQHALVHLHASSSTKELQHNTVMTVPYGEAEYGIRSYTGNIDLKARATGWEARLVTGMGRRRIGFRDLAESVYDWNGDKVRDRNVPGELGDATNQMFVETSGFARLTAERVLTARQRLRIAVGPSVYHRRGEDHVVRSSLTFDPLRARRELRHVISGVEHELQLPHDIENIAFVKHYGVWSRAEDVTTSGMFVPIDQSHSSFGFGDAFRWRIDAGLWLKGSYEHSTRLPTVDELFGDGIMIQPNLALEPEVSHNANAGVHLEREGGFGSYAVELDGFGRLADQLIIVLGNDRAQRYQNVWGARVVGAEAGFSYTVPGTWASIDGSGTLQDIRNNSGRGPFGAFQGDRIPNRPWLLGSLSATLRTRDLVRPGDEVSLFGSSRYVHKFYRSWESIGLQEYKQSIPSQLVSSVGVTYALRSATPVLTTFEVQNVTDAMAFDSFGVQRPGRAYYVKVSGEL